ncbi:MAG TPA: twin-arginine translocase TatA/TatE family subunit [Solirubrobacteraceae bacterium]|jgi:sec-independent protein translocase protein TatA|nr:twin-arginine translocase TatA/TatE family subunit [Solirubrobacteraceae bacterium]
MAGLDNPIHLMFLLGVLLLVFGAKRLPEMGRSLGSGLRGFKDALSTDAPQQHLLERDTSAAAQPPAASALADLRSVAAAAASGEVGPRPT